MILSMDSVIKPIFILLVPDEFRHGYPVGLCISNKENEQAILCFLNAVKNKSSHTKIYTLVTDDDNAGRNIMQQRMFFGCDICDLSHF